MLEKLRNLEEACWRNPRELPTVEAQKGCILSMEDVLDAAARWQRFAAYFRVAFPETGDGIIESPLKEIPNMKKGAGCFGTAVAEVGQPSSGVRFH